MNNGGHLAIRTAKRVAVMALLVPVGGGCGGRGDPVGAASLQAHLQATDERLAATEKRLESLATAVEECNRHFATTESQAVPAREEPPTAQMRPRNSDRSAPAVPAMNDRQLALKAVDDEFRERLARLRSEYGDAGGSPERQRALNDLYR